MANKRLGTATVELKLQTKKDKTTKKPKWQAKIGGKKGKPEPVAETPDVAEPGVVADSPALAAEPTETSVVAATPEAANVEPDTTDNGATTPDVAAELPNITDESTKKPRKLKVKADAPPKKLRMMAASLQVLQAHKVAMTCPELIDVMATED